MLFVNGADERNDVSAAEGENHERLDVGVLETATDIGNAFFVDQFPVEIQAPDENAEHDVGDDR